MAAAQGMHIVTKPIGPVCNLGCAYCFFLEKRALYETFEEFRITDRRLQRMTVSTTRLAAVATPAWVRVPRKAIQETVGPSV